MFDSEGTLVICSTQNLKKKLAEKEPPVDRQEGPKSLLKQAAFTVLQTIH